MENLFNEINYSMNSLINVLQNDIHKFFVYFEIFFLFIYLFWLALMFGLFSSKIVDEAKKKAGKKIRDFIDKKI